MSVKELPLCLIERLETPPQPLLIKDLRARSELRLSVSVDEPLGRETVAAKEHVAEPAPEQMEQQAELLLWSLRELLRALESPLYPAEPVLSVEGLKELNTLTEELTLDQRRGATERALREASDKSGLFFSERALLLKERLKEPHLEW